MVNLWLMYVFTIDTCGLEHGLIFHNIWDVIQTPLMNSIIFQDGYCTTNQLLCFEIARCGIHMV